MADSAREALRNAEGEIRGFAYGTTKKVWVKDSLGFGYVSVLDASALNTMRSALGERGRYEDLAVPGKLSPPPEAIFSGRDQRHRKATRVICFSHAKRRIGPCRDV